VLDVARLASEKSITLVTLITVSSDTSTFLKAEGLLVGSNLGSVDVQLYTLGASESNEKDRRTNIASEANVEVGKSLTLE